MNLVPAVGLVSPLWGLLTCVVVHALVSRARPALSHLRGIEVSLLAGLGVVTGIALATGGGAPWAPKTHPWEVAVLWVLTYLLLGYCYVIGFFNLGESARRIRLLIELHGAGERGLTLENILSAYNARMIVEARLHRLISGGQIAELDGRYVVKRPFMLYIARFLVLLKMTLLGARSEFGSRRRPKRVEAA